MKNKSIVITRQQPLIENYFISPEEAWVTDVAIVEGKNISDPFHTSVSINEELKTAFPVGVHRAVGGLHDAPNPGDILCASLASCFESTLRMIANRLKIELFSTHVKVSANVDVRGTLMVSKTVPVGFQNMTIDVTLEVDETVNEFLTNKLLIATEQCCIIFQTLKQGIPIHIEHDVQYLKSRSNKLNLIHKKAS